MALTPRLEFRQTQSLTLTPQLMQSIRLLQLSHLELNAFVETELLRNPLLDRQEAESDAEPAEQPEAPAELDAYEDTVDHGERIQSADSIANGLDTAVENVFPEEGGPGGSGPGQHGSADSGEGADLDQFVSSRQSLADHLSDQIGLILDEAADRLVGRYLIDSLDPAGYLDIDLEQVATDLGTSAQHVESVLKRVQGVDPVGVFARSLSECLAIQLRDKNRLDPLMERMLAHLDLLAAHELTALGRIVGVDREDLIDMIGEIKALDPRPGLAYDGAPVEAVVPDVFIRRGPDGGWAVELNSDILPRVLVNRTYYASVSKRTREPGEKAFLTDCLASASWLAKSLDQRAQTILKVAVEMVRQQEGFLEHGISHLRPMTLRMVADAIEMHESTVSRVTSNKYVATPRGLFEMKYFFTTALASSAGGEEHSAEAVRHRIRQLVESESADAILSDDTIAEMLQKEQGIEVARRTVAKYREGMNIPSSVVRRRQKRSPVLAR